VGQTPPPFDAVRAEVTAALRHRQLVEITNHLLEDLRARARIEIFL
jgi:hypothetical protein